MRVDEINGLSTLYTGENDSIATLLLAYSNRLATVKVGDIISDMMWDTLTNPITRKLALANAQILSSTTGPKLAKALALWADKTGVDKLRLCLDSHLPCAFLFSAAQAACNSTPGKQWYIRLSNVNFANSLSFAIGHDHCALPGNLHVRVHIETGDELYLGCFKQLTYSESSSSISERDFFPKTGEEDATIKALLYKSKR